MKIESANALLDHIDARCDEDGDCLVWRGTVNHGKPTMTIEGREHGVRRLVWSMTRGREVPRGVYMVDTCDNPRCCTPSHLRAFTKRQYLQLAWERKKFDSLTRVVRLRETARAKAPKLDEQKARQIFDRVHARKEAGETLESIAAEFGIHLSMAHRIGAGLSWKPTTGLPGSSVFNMGANA